MQSIVSWWRRLLSRSALAWTTLSFIVMYVAFVVLQGDAWIRIWLKGDSYFTYQLVFVPAMLIGCSVLLSKSQWGRKGLVASAASGGALGYLCGLFAYIAVALVMPDGADRLVRNFSRFSSLDFAMLLVLPLILLNWLLGMVLGVMAAIAQRNATH